MEGDQIEFFLNIPSNSSLIWKEECCYCFEKSGSSKGLNLSLSRWISYCDFHLDNYIKCFSNKEIFMRIKKNKLPISNSAQKNVQDGVLKSLRIEYEHDQYADIETCEGLIMINKGIKNDISDQLNVSTNIKLKNCVSSLLKSNDIFQKKEIENWDESNYIISKFSNDLLQLKIDCKIDIESKTLKCEKCELNNNLWMNLTDGSILCGRKQYDGSGGNNHAFHHYQKFGFPLAVKIGTITVDSADVYSYVEDCMVVDSNLDFHLKHFGINRSNLFKKEKTILELEIDANQFLKTEESFILESDKVLTPIYGNGLVGLENIGNSCYFNCVIQLLFNQQNIKKIFDYEFDYGQKNPTCDILTQIKKYVDFINNNNSTDKVSICPKMLKIACCFNHQEFNSSKQQDAFEFFMHFLNKFTSSTENNFCSNFKELFFFKMQDSFKFLNNQQKPMIMHHKESFLSLPLSRDMIISEDLSVSSKKIPSVSWNLLWSKLLFSEEVDWFEEKSGSSKAIRSTRMIANPRYLVIQIRRYYYVDGFYKKFDSKVNVPLELDIETLIEPEKEQSNKHYTPSYNDVNKNCLVKQLTDIGMDLNISKKVIYEMNVSDLETALNIIMDNNFDSQNYPNDSSNTLSLESNNESLQLLMSMGFSKEKSLEALKNTNGSIERSIDYLYSRVDQNDQVVHSNS